MQRQIDSGRKSLAGMYNSYIESHPGSMVIAYALASYIDTHGEFSSEDIERIKSIYLSLAPDQERSYYGQRVKKKLDSFTITEGMTAPSFSQSDTEGKEIPLDSFKGKYVLLDFWASWCLPCRRENPNLVRLYNLYREKGFTIVSISVERAGDKNKWIDAIRKDGLVWTNLSDLQYWNNSAAKLYRISALPQNFLIDPLGKIVGKDLFGTDLEKKLEALMY